jgi:hypothetical protein
MHRADFPDVWRRPHGEFVAAWLSIGPEASDDTVPARAFARNAVPVGDELRFSAPQSICL